MMSNLPMILGCCAVTLLASTAHAQSMDAWAGTWNLNLARSRFNPGPPPQAPPTATTVTLDVVDGVLRIIADAVDESGQPSHTVRMMVFDGRQHGGEGTSNSWVYTWVDPTHYEWSTIVGGHVTTRTQLTLSSDRKTQKLVTTGRNLRGEVVKNVTVFEKP